MVRNLHEADTLQLIIGRINNLKADNHAQWGKMNVSQMLAHCSNAIETNLGDRKGKRGLMAMLFGRIAKKSVVSDKPFKQGLPTDPSFVVTDKREFEQERERLIGAVTRLSQSDPQALAQNPHPFFGQMTAQEWNMLNYKHLDHHLRQFGA